MDAELDPAQDDQDVVSEELRKVPAEKFAEFVGELMKLPPVQKPSE